MGDVVWTRGNCFVVVTWTASLLIKHLPETATSVLNVTANTVIFQLIVSLVVRVSCR